MLSKLNYKLKTKKMKTTSKLLIAATLFAVVGTGIISCSKDKKTPTPTPIPTLPPVNNVITITDNGSGTGTTTWTKDKTYILNGMVFVNSGQILTIQAGTVIKGKPGTGANASALIVARGGKINAVGTPTQPIIFTFEADPLNGSVSLATSGQWGGVMILGNATLNSTPGTSAIEGIPTTETRGIYGGTDDNDNSGTFKYVSIRHGGTDIGAGNEINGLTMGGVGSGTTIEYVEVVGNADDGFEWFGGTVNTKYLVASNGDDDSFDYDEGFRGKGQFWLAIQNVDADRGGEHDGGTTPEDGTPYATPKIFNATFIGNGTSRAITFRDNAGGEYHNSIFHNFGKGIDIEDLASGEDSKNRLDVGDLKLDGIVLSNIGADLIVSVDVTDPISPIITDVSAHASVTNLTVQSVSISATNPIATGLAAGTAPSDPWFTNVTYKGAFNPSAGNWAQGWTLTFP